MSTLKQDQAVRYWNAFTVAIKSFHPVGERRIAARREAWARREAMLVEAFRGIDTDNALRRICDEPLERI